MSYCQATDPFAEVYTNGSLIVTFEDPPINYSITQFAYSKTIHWDNQSLVKYYPEDITYSIENIPGLPYKIWWDNTQSHLINNPNTYSYQIVYFQRYRIAIDQVTTGGVITGTAYTPPFQSNSFPSIISCLSGASGYKYFSVSRPGQTNLNTGLTDRKADCTSGYSAPSGTLQCSTARILRNTCFVSGVQTQIRILDGGIEYLYSITNTNSIWIENSVASKKININGTKYDLINENSIYITESQKYRLTITSQSQTIEQVYSTSPTIEVKCGEDCPPDTCKVECNDHYCCYNSLGNVVKTFPK